MVFCCFILLTIICEGIESYNFLLNDNNLLSFYTHDTLSFIVAHNITATTLAVSYPLIYYIQNPEDVDSVIQFNLETRDKRTAAEHLLTITGLTADEHTLYTLEMGRYDIDSMARLSAFSLTTGKHKVLWSAEYGSDPRALFLDSTNRILFFGLASGSIMMYNITSSQSGLVTSQYDMWPTTICVNENVLYMYNSRTFIAHDMTKNSTVFTLNTPSWEIFQLSGKTLCSFEDVEQWLDTHQQIRGAKSTVPGQDDFELHMFNLVLLGVTDRGIDGDSDLEYCQGCDLCLAGLCDCVFGEDESGMCKAVPDRFLVMSQVRSLSLVEYSEHFIESGELAPQSHVTRLYLTSLQWWMGEVEYDHVSGTIFWIELESQFISLEYGNMQPHNSRIMKMGQDMRPEVLYYEPGRQVDSISVNSEDGLLYWLDAKASLIIAAKTSCSQDHCLRTSLVNEHIDPYSRFLEVSGSVGLIVYVSGNNELITRNLDGSNPKVILSANLLQISCIALHRDSVYILTRSSGWVVRLPLVGGGQEIVYRQLSEFIPISMAFLDGRLYVASELRRSLVEVDFEKQTSVDIANDVRGVKSITNGYHDTGHQDDIGSKHGKSDDGISYHDFLGGNLGDIDDDNGYRDDISGNIGNSDDDIGNNKEVTSCDEECEHFCFRLAPNNHSCGCADGFILDSGSCQEPPYIFLSTGNFIQTFQPFPSTGNIAVRNILFQSEAEIIAMDFFHDKKCLVWIDGNLKTISKSYWNDEKDMITGDKISNMVVDGLTEPTDISGDWISSVVYWIDRSRDTISAVALEGGSGVTRFRKVLVRHALRPTSFLVNPLSGKMFWVGWEKDVALIRSASMDGSNVTTLVSRPGSWPTDITIDYQSGRVVWVDARNSVVVSMSGEGTDLKIIMGTLFMGYPVAINVWHGYTYWVDSHRDSVSVAESSNLYDVIRLTPGSHVSDIVLSHQLKQSGSNSCSSGNGGCTNVCVPVTHTTHVCMCPDGMALKSDSLGKCYALPQELIGVNLNPYLLGVNSVPYRLSHQRLHNAVKIAVYYEQQSIFWLDNERSSIETVHVNGTGYRTVYQSTYQATDIKVDWMGSNVYWSEADSKSVKCVTVSGEFDKLIVMTQSAPMFLLLDPPLSHLFWMECEELVGQGSLYQSTMSGSHFTLLLTTPSCPDSMDIARETRTIFWNIAATLYQVHYDIEQQGEGGWSLVVSSSHLPFATRQIVWIEENLFALREPGRLDRVERSEDEERAEEEERGEVISEALRSEKEDTKEGWEDVRVMMSVDRLETVMIDVMNSSCFAAFTPLDAGYSDCDVDNGDCTHFCFLEEGGAQCGCPAQQTLLPDNRTCTRLGSECEAGEFRCGSGECILEEYVCSFNPECLDKSDEAGCGWCEEFEFSCGGDRCIPSTAVCDGLWDCEGGEDEASTECSQCHKTGHICKGSGICLPRSMKCDGVPDCEAGDDERKCPKQEEECGELEWRCHDGTCIMRQWLCDKYPDCAGDEDEQDCEACEPDTELDCGYSQCISIAEKCDGIIQCLHDGRDEIDCQTCRKGQSKCDNGQCRASSRWCDHVWDCSDRSDEWNCNYTTIVDQDTHKSESHVTPTLTIIFGTLFMSVVVVGLLYRFKILPRVRSTYKQLTQASNKTVETNVCVTTNTYSELETTVCSSENASQRRIKSVDPYETLTTSSLSSSLKPLNAQNPYERFGIAPVQSTTDVSVAEGPPPSIVSGGGYSSGPGASSRALSARSLAPSAKSRAPSAKSRALSGRSRATSGARSRAPVSYHVNTNIIWDDHINSISDYEHGCLSDNLHSEYSVRLPSKLPTTPITSDNDD